ncbi:MAG: hypothetical protein ACI9MR_000118 [Myxococcota bacterium]|jgi:hypothetical protein
MNHRMRGILAVGARPISGGSMTPSSRSPFRFLKVLTPALALVLLLSTDAMAVGSIAQTTCGAVSQRACCLGENSDLPDGGCYGNGVYVQRANQGKCFDSPLSPVQADGYCHPFSAAVAANNNRTPASVTAATSQMVQNAAKALSSDTKAFINALQARVDDISQATMNKLAAALHAANRAGALGSDLKTLMKSLADDLGLVPGQTNSLTLPANVTDSSVGVYAQFAASAIAGYSSSYTILLGLSPQAGHHPMALVHQVGVSLGVQVGAAAQFGILWQPGSVDDAPGWSVGIGGGGSIGGVGGGVGLSWSVAAGMENAPNAWTQAIPGVQIGYEAGASLSVAVQAGYAGSLARWNGPAASAGVIADAPDGSPGNTFYTINAAGNLFRSHQRADGVFDVVNKEIGQGWSGFKHIFAAEGGHLYAISTDGKLRYYHYNGTKFDVVGRVIGTGWGDALHAFAGRFGEIYLVTSDGKLKYFKHDASLTFAAPSEIGVGFNDASFARVFSGGHHTIYVVTTGGALKYYRHNSSGTFVAGGGIIGSSGWGSAAVASTGNGELYTVNAAGDLRVYRHDTNQKFVTGSGTIRGTGWSPWVASPHQLIPSTH